MPVNPIRPGPEEQQQPAAVKRLIDESRSLRKRPALQADEVAVKVAPRWHKHQSGKFYLRYQTSSWPVEFFDLSQGSFRRDGLWLVLKRGGGR